MYINIETKEILTREELEAAHTEPLVTFPLEVVDEVLLDFGYANLQYHSMPDIAANQILEAGPVVQEENGYFKTWIVTDRVITTSDVDIERDRRVDVGVTFEGHVYQNRSGDRENITGASQLAMMAIMSGSVVGDYRWSDPDSDFQWITMDNSVVTMDAYDVINLGRASAAFKQKMIFCARDLKDKEVIPSDYTDDKWWT